MVRGLVVVVKRKRCERKREEGEKCQTDRQGG